jgi:hypothetical protein
MTFHATEQFEIILKGIVMVMLHTYNYVTKER